MIPIFSSSACSVTRAAFVVQPRFEHDDVALIS